MFTGIVEEMGEIKEIKHVSEKALQMEINAKKVAADVKIGDSIAINGVCLTITDYEEDKLYVDVMPETIQATSLAGLKAGQKVNMERALRVDDRFGGHFVSGHVDGIGEIVRKEPMENAIYYDIRLPNELICFMLKKGSVTVDGISLTLFEVNQDKGTITLSLIPHTLEVTVLGEKEVHDIVNIECDMLAKHVQHYMRLHIQS